MTSKSTLRRRKWLDNLWKDQIVLPDEVEKWVVSMLIISEFTYELKIPQEKSLHVWSARRELSEAFTKRECAARYKETPLRYRRRGGDKWMSLASATSWVIHCANELREAMGLPKFPDQESSSHSKKSDDASSEMLS